MVHREGYKHAELAGSGDSTSQSNTLILLHEINIQIK